MQVLFKTKNTLGYDNFYASIDMLKYIEELNEKKDIKCEHKNIGTDKHFMEIICKNEEIFNQLKDKATPKKMLEYAAVVTLNGNLILKEQSKVKETDEVEIELYGPTLENIKEQFKEHKKELKDLENGLPANELRELITSESKTKDLEL